ncbi:MAG: ParA family protein [Gammaproteobacteria bacterium]|nr:MAG: ParA family protein [Gammaproteobacteria bacterium]
MRRVVFNQKGGVGKSTITCNMAAIGASEGLRTLVIDLDPQANATRYLRARDATDEETAGGTAGFYRDTLGFSFSRRTLADYIEATPFDNLDLLASSTELDDLAIKLESRYKMFKLREALDALNDYDAVWIDTPPALNFYSRSALIAAERCLIPFDCDDFSRQALYALLDSIDEIRADPNNDLEIEGIVVNQFQSRARLPRQLVDQLRDEGLPVIDAFLSSSVRIRESHEQARPMVYLDRRHKLTGEFRALHQVLQGAACTQGA